MIRSTTLGLLLVAACNNSTPTNTGTPVATTTTPSSTASTAPAASILTDAAVVSTSPKPPPAITDQFMTPLGELTVTPIHHATVLLRVANKAIYIDPVDKDASYDGLPKADYIFITDIHPDHMDPAGVARIKKDDTVLVGPEAVNEKLPLGIVIKNGATHEFTTFTVEGVPMYNLTRGPSAGKHFHDKGRGDGYVFTFGKGAKKAGAADSGTIASRFYISGDTECTPEMKALKSIDVAFVCMNLPYTMPPAEAATCINAFKPKVVFPFHYRGSNLDELVSSIKTGSAIDVRRREWY